jgi:hypothetical protein
MRGNEEKVEPEPIWIIIAFVDFRDNTLFKFIPKRTACELAYSLPYPKF